MRKAKIFVHNRWAGILEEKDEPRHYVFSYLPDYEGAAVSLTMPLGQRHYLYEQFPPFFEGLLPEGVLLEALLRNLKLNHDDYFGQLAATGEDLVGAVSFKLHEDE
jgi:serine/threonine-protein kinase HipA